MKKGVKKFWALLGALLIMFTSILTSLVNAVNLNTASVTFEMPDHAVSLMAISEANGYTIIFNGNWNTNSGTTMADLSMTYDESKPLTTNTYTKVWYTFLWWSTDSTATVATYTDWQQVNNLVTEWSITLYAIWSANTYQVRFNPNPGEDTLNEIVWTMSNQDFTYDTTWALTSGIYTRAWYTFLWWSRNSLATEATYTNWQEVSNLTTVSWDVVDLYAIWSANTDTKYTVNHYLMKVDWTYPENPTYSGEFTATTYEVVSPTPRNDDWFTLSWSAQTWHVKWDGTTVFDYYYIRNDYTVTLHAWRWIQSVSWDWSYKFNQTVTVSAILKTWYENLTWTWTYDIDTFSMPATGVDMTANATPISYTISLDVWTWTIDLWSGAISWQTTITYDIEQNVVVPDPTKTWYDFVWWSWTNFSTPKTWLVISAGTWHQNLTYEAVWSPRSNINYVVHHYIKKVWEELYYQEVQRTYTTWTADEMLMFANYKDVNIPCVTYAGWSLTLSTWWLTNAETEFRVMPDGSTEVYLYYTRNVHNVTLSMDDHIASVTLSGDVSTVEKTRSIECWATVTINAEAKTWYHFLRWDDIWASPLNPVNP